MNKAAEILFVVWIAATLVFYFLLVVLPKITGGA